MEVIIIKGSEDKILSALHEAFELKAKKKQVPLHIKKKKKPYALKAKLNKTQLELLNIFLSNNSNFYWNDLLEIFNATNSKAPSNALLYRHLIEKGFSKIKTIHNQKIKNIWIKK